MFIEDTNKVMHIQFTAAYLHSLAKEEWEQRNSSSNADCVGSPVLLPALQAKGSYISCFCIFKVVVG